MLNRFLENLIGRLHGPLTFRLILQPVMAALLAIRAGLHDARGGRPVYLWGVLSRRGRRRERLLLAWKDLRRLLFLAVALDVLYQIVVLRWVYPLEALVVAALLAILPYFAMRLLVQRVLRARSRLYLLLLTVQSAGAAIVYWYTLPLYRQTVAAPLEFEPRPLERTAYSLAAVVLIQVPYWIGYRLRPPLPRLVNAPLGHALLFLARLNFLLAASIYSFVFVLGKMAHVHLPGTRIAVLVALLFSLFCYTLELERLGGRFLGR